MLFDELSHPDFARILEKIWVRVSDRVSQSEKFWVRVSDFELLFPRRRGFRKFCARVEHGNSRRSRGFNNGSQNEVPFEIRAMPLETLPNIKFWRFRDLVKLDVFRKLPASGEADWDKSVHGLNTGIVEEYADKKSRPELQKCSRTSQCGWWHLGTGFAEKTSRNCVRWDPDLRKL